MKRKTGLLLLALFLWMFTIPLANAATLVMEGAIIQEFYDADDTSLDTISVDYWNFTVAQAGTVTIDVLSWEKDPDDWSWKDVNQDGEQSFIDASVHIFKGSLSSGNIYVSNDDNFASLGNDGTIRGNDAYISQDFEAGDYIIAISSCGYPPGYFSVDEAVAGLNQIAIIPYSEGEGDYGDYRITITGNVSAVPVPGAFFLFGAGLLGLTGLNRPRIKD